MRLPRRVPWASLAELEKVCSWIYTDDNDIDAKVLAINRLSAWRAITPLPHALESTLSILVVIFQDATQASSTSSLLIRQSYSAAIIRLVNGLVDPLQLGVYARSIASIANQLGLPPWLVELRHAATHEDLPSIELLREAARESMTWLLHNYFLPTINPANLPETETTLRSLEPTLKQYKKLLKITLRDTSLKAKYKSEVVTVLKDVERWIAEAQVAGNVAAREVGWDTSNSETITRSSSRDVKEQWALERLCDTLLEKGYLVPLSKKKRDVPVDTFLPPQFSVQLWTPLLQHLQSLHSQFYSILVRRIMSVLLPESGLVPPDEATQRDASYVKCLARWTKWIIDDRVEEQSSSSLDFRKDVAIMILQSLGHLYTASRWKANSATESTTTLLESLCEDDPDLQLALTALKTFSLDVQPSDWSLDDISAMDQRLNVLLSPDSGLSPSRPASPSGNDVITTEEVAGWRLLHENSGWRPCPIGVHYSMHSSATNFMKLNSPIPQPLSKECSKAARIYQFHLVLSVKSFVDDHNNGLDGVIPRSVLENAKGFAIFTIFKAGFLFSARAGSGIVIARLDDGNWSAPSAIGTAGVGVGGQAGAEMTDFLVVLNTRARSFMAAGSLTLGGNMSIALGPLGRNGEASGALNSSGKVAAMYSYSKTRGLFGGISVEGSVIVERQDANHQAYNSPVTARMLLGGIVEAPEWASPLIRTLESCTGTPSTGRRWVEDGFQRDGPYAFGPASSPTAEQNPSFWQKKKSCTEAFTPGKRKDFGSYFESTEGRSNRLQGRAVTDWDQDIPSTSQSNPFNPTRPRFGHVTSSSSVSTTSLEMSYDNPARAHRPRALTEDLSSSSHLSTDPPTLINMDHTSSAGHIQPHAVGTHEAQGTGLGRAIALYNFNAIEVT
ncbi:hypothetical protein H0H93_013040 [Arthromyces matolae]|nr:hypothetical protein H0H93_013040 [Arthromyces matolae]